MMRRLNLRQKIIFSIIGTAAFLFACTIGFFFVSSSNSLNKSVKAFNLSVTQHYASVVEGSLNQDLSVVRTLSGAWLEHGHFPFEQWQEMMLDMYRQVMVQNPHIDAVWDSWELSYIDSEWDKPYGRLYHIIYSKQGKLFKEVEYRSLDGDAEAYARVKREMKEVVNEPYFSQDSHTDEMMTSLVAPLKHKGKFVGMVGIDLFLGSLQTLVADIKPFEEVEPFLITSEGTIVAHPDTAYLGKNVKDMFALVSEKYKLTEQVRKEKSFSFVERDHTGERRAYTISPISLGRDKSIWALVMAVPERVIMNDANRAYNIGVFVGVAGMILLVIVVSFLATTIANPIKRITGLLLEVSKGKIDKSLKISFRSQDEIAQMGAALAESIDGLIAKTEFAKCIGSGELNADLTLLSDEDVLGHSLIEMQKNLLKNRQEEEERKKEESKRNWVNEGLTKFGEILRANNDLNQLGDELISNLVLYLNASVGGLFVKNEDNIPSSYDLVSAYAYDRKRYIQKSFEHGEGLVGTCAAEADTIYLKEIPQDYMNITSGLGVANPSTILLIPLLVEHEVLGVMEIASLNTFEDYEIEFVERLGENIALTLRTVTINQKTAELLAQSQEQHEQLAAQEEEMRQNIEELHATQEEALRKSFEMQGLIDALNASSYVMEYDLNGYIISINDSYLNILGLRRDEAIGLHHSENIVMSAEQQRNYDEFWGNLKMGKVQKITNTVNIKGRDLTFVETYTPVQNENHEIYKVIKVAIDATSVAEAQRKE